MWGIRGLMGARWLQVSSLPPVGYLGRRPHAEVPDISQPQCNQRHFLTACSIWFCACQPILWWNLTISSYYITHTLSCSLSRLFLPPYDKKQMWIGQIRLLPGVTSSDKEVRALGKEGRRHTSSIFTWLTLNSSLLNPAPVGCVMRQNTNLAWQLSWGAHPYYWFGISDQAPRSQRCDKFEIFLPFAQ